MLSHQPKDAGYANHLPFRTHRMIAPLWSKIKRKTASCYHRQFAESKSPEGTKLQVRGSGHAGSRRLSGNLSDFKRRTARAESQQTKEEGADVLRSWKHLPTGRWGSKTVSKDTVCLSSAQKTRTLCINKTLCIKEHRRKKSPKINSSV